MNRITLIGLLLVAFGIVTLLGSPFVYAADQVVNNCANDTELRSDLATMQSSSGGTLTFNCGTATIALTSQLPNITTSTTIDGGGKITLNGGGGVRPLQVDNTGTLTVKNIVLENGYGGTQDGGAIYSTGHHVTLDHATIQGSYSPFRGGAIYTTGLLDITNSTLSNNIATSGGAIYAEGVNTGVTITTGTLDNNQGTGKALGGAVYISGTLTINNSEFSGNMAGSGGAIYASPAVATSSTTISGSTFHDNKTTGLYPNANGGAVLVDGVSVSISSSVLQNNHGQSGAAIYVLPSGRLTLTDSTLSNNSSTNGGGIYNKQGTATLTGVTISGNSGSHGGGIDNFGTLNLTNVTVSGNSATYGGGLKNEAGTATLTNVTLSNNTGSPGLGGGIYNLSGVNIHLNLKNVIVANSPGGGNCKFDQAPDSSSFNLSSDATCSFGAGRDSVNLLLGPLANNGGSTLTYLPSSSPKSPAIDNGTNTGCPSTDQRGVSRPQSGVCDVGSVEVRPGTPTPTHTPTRTPTKTPTPTSTPSGCAGKPDAAVLTAPANGATVTKARVKLTWLAAHCAKNYKVIVRDHATGNIAVKQGGLVVLKFKTAPLPRGKTYAWFVKACNPPSGCTKSAVFTFTLP